MIKNTVVWSKPDDSIPRCYQCISTKKFLDKYGAEYTVEDVTTPEGLEYAKSLGFSQAPIVVVTKEDGTTDSWSGFNPIKILEYFN